MRLGRTLLWRSSTTTKLPRAQTALRSDLIVEAEHDDEDAASPDHFANISLLEKAVDA